jgi:cysteine/histidine-rich domain-containing protein
LKSQIVELKFNRSDVCNSQGCTKSYHSNEKPPEAERPPVNKSNSDEVIEYKTPQPPVFEPLERPPFESPLVSVKNAKDKR